VIFDNQGLGADGIPEDPLPKFFGDLLAFGLRGERGLQIEHTFVGVEDDAVRSA
jgi:hypothetical protein